MARFTISPIHGADLLERIKDKDFRKQIELQQLGFNLLVIDTSRLRYIKVTESFLDEYYPSHIKPLLDE